MRAELDGVTGREVLRPENYAWVNEALWAPDASFVVVATAPNADVCSGGRAELVYLDGRPGVVLADYAEEMK